MTYKYELHSDCGALVKEADSFEEIVEYQNQYDSEDNVLWIFRVDEHDNAERLLGGRWHEVKPTKINWS